MLSILVFTVYDRATKSNHAKPARLSYRLPYQPISPRSSCVHGPSVHCNYREELPLSWCESEPRGREVEDRLENRVKRPDLIFSVELVDKIFWKKTVVNQICLTYA